MPLLKDAKATLVLAWPIMVGQLAQTGTAFVDAVMAGHVSAADLAAVSVGASIWTTLIVTLMGLLLAISPLASAKVGANQRDALPMLTQQALYQALLAGTVAILIAHAVLPVFNHLGLASEVADKAGRFLSAVSWGLPALAVSRVLYGYSSALNQTKPMMIISLIALALNIPANWILIYGHLGFPALGAVGCGWATAFCMWVSALMWFVWICYAPIYRGTHPFDKLRGINWNAQWQLAKLGIPIGIMFFIEVSAFSLIALLIARLGTTAVAAHQVALNFASLLFMIPMAISTALTVRVGHAAGAGNWQQARLIGQNGVRLGLIVAGIGAAITMIFGAQIARLYTQDIAVLALATQLLVLAGIFQFSDATQVVASGILRGYQATRLPMLLHMTAFWVIGLPLGYALAFGIGPIAAHGAQGFWIALVIALTFAALSLLWLFRRVSLKHLNTH
ncbi:MATE family efflux transporter [Chitinibacter bivalviorum]|uniref:Multidrug-efflux transporter n=1 Tax=Chitinibacter bivalviorum TaxID=2739434 RepID=A0A7H9BEP8_9NEIS|nr:MATE family efflux transporter [Chitinibacter bivalviorum]QLG87045.1 MATE family efflux transporter [Chitinibacter bivalviorum]